MKYRASKQRDQIVEYLNRQSTHMSAEQIYADLNHEGAEISLATVYRNLNILEDMNRIKKIALSDGFVYDKTTKPHYHFYCTKCKTLYDLNKKYDDAFMQLEKDDLIGQVESCEITIKGICSRCM